jgi:sirohydrochlorin cobaltochelatase
VLILIAHGSRNQGWRASVERVVSAVAAGRTHPSVRLAYMDCTPPTLMDVATEAVAAGERTLLVLPLFLAEEGHVERDVRPLVDEVRRIVPQFVHVELLDPVGQQPEFTDVLGRIAERVRSS